MTDFSLLITDWFRQNGRSLPWRETSDPYFIWLSEIILQQTRVDQGMAYYHKFTTNYPRVEDLANASEQQVLNDWQGLGYYSRARNLHAAAKMIMSELNGAFPNSYNEIIKLQGVGAYTAAAISSIAFSEKKAVVDGNVYRVLSRVFDINTPIDSTKGKKEFQLLADELISELNPGDHNQALMELGALICTPAKPDCMNCPVNSKCLSFKHTNWSERPVKEKKTKVRSRHFQYFIFDDGEHTIIEKRGDKDIWANMFQFPLQELKEPELQWGPGVHSSKQIKHVLSHQHIHAVFHHYDKIPSEINDQWMRVKWSDLEDFPLPRLIDKYIEENLNRD
jgi:A/G-specific adenine glycosylase